MNAKCWRVLLACLTRTEPSGRGSLRTLIVLRVFWSAPERASIARHFSNVLTVDGALGFCSVPPYLLLYAIRLVLRRRPFKRSSMMRN